MKVFLQVCTALICLGLFNSVQSQLLQQQFSTSFSDIAGTGNMINATYINTTTPTNSQFTAIKAQDGRMSIVGDGSTISFTRNNGGTGIMMQHGAFSTTSLMLQFTINVTSVSSNSSTNPVIFNIGAFTNSDTTSSATSPANTNSLFGIGFIKTPASFYLAPTNATIASPTHTYAGAQTITFVTNRSGSSLTYRAPDGSFESVANNTYDLWAGTTKELNDQAATNSANALTGFKMTFGSSTTSNFTLDNILIDPIPGIPTSSAASSINASNFTANWSTISGVTGYRIDVATDAGFTSLVSGFNNLYVSGQATSSQLVTGLNGSTTYYYRVRGASQYTAGEFAGDNSATQTPSTLLPVELTAFNAFVKGKNIELKWNTATETNNAGFEVERKTSDQWNKIGFVEGNGTTNTPNEYRFVDAVHGGMTYSYRLKQIDRDGKFEYSPIVEATTTLTAQDYQLTQNYPNPFNPSTTFSFAMKNAEQTTVKVYNLVGQEVATLFNGIANPNQVYTMKFDGKDLSSGIYFYSLRSGSRNEMKKMMLLK